VGTGYAVTAVRTGDLSAIAVNSAVKAAIPGFMGRPMAYKLFGIFAIASIIAAFVAVLRHSLWPSA